jgi:hypothetical protein
MFFLTVLIPLTASHVVTTKNFLTTILETVFLLGKVITVN